MSGAAPSGGLSVALSSSSPSAGVPASVLVPAGASSAGFTVTTQSVASATTATLSAGLNGVTKTAALTVNPAVSCTAATLSSLTVGYTSGQVTLSGPPLAGGEVVSLHSDNPSILVPLSVLVQGQVQGQTNGTYGATFPVTVGKFVSPVTVTITATYHGSAQTAMLTLTGNPQVPQGGSAAVTFPAKGTDTTANGAYGVDVVDPSKQVVASSTSSSSALNGWTISASSPGGSGSGQQFSVQAPAAAVVATGYEIRSYGYGYGSASAFFDVTPAGSASSAGSGSAGSTTPQGFTVTTVVKDIANPNGMVVTPGGALLAGTEGSGFYRFPADTDGQSISDPGVTNNASPVLGMVTTGATIYGTTNDGRVVTVDPGTGAVLTTVVSYPGISDGITVNPVTGHLVVSGTDIIDIDPSLASPVATPLVRGVRCDAVAVSGDGSIVFACGGQIVGGWDITPGIAAGGSGALLYTFDNDTGDPDGLTVGYGTLANKLFVNYNAGYVKEFDFTVPNPQGVVIASNVGTGGDLAATDPNGTLLITTGSSIQRLTPPPGGRFGAPPGQAVYTRDDLPHPDPASASRRALTQAYAPFGITAPQTTGSAAIPAAFDATGIAGNVSAAQMQRAGQTSFSGGGQFDAQWGVSSLASAGLSSYGPVLPSAQAGGSPAPYQVVWALPTAFLADIQAQLGDDYQVSLSDQLSSLCGPINFADAPHQNWPAAKNTLTFVAAPTAGLQIPQGRCLDVLLNGHDAPLNGAWDVTQNGTVIASSGQPNGWDAEDDHTVYGGVTLTIPASAGTNANYELRFVGQAAGSVSFAVAPAGTISTAAILRPLTLSQSALVGGSSAALTGTVNLDAPAPRGQAPDAAHPAGGVYVTLTSSSPALTAPAYVFIPAGQTGATFSLGTQTVSTPTPVSLLASYNGYRVAAEVVLDATTGSGIGTGGGTGGGGVGLGGGLIVTTNLLTPPTNLTATGGDGVVTLNWTAATTTTQLPITYNVARAQTKSGPFTLIFRGLSQTQFVDRSVTNGTTYYYFVNAALPLGESNSSNEAAATPLGGTVATPSITPNGGAFQDSVSVTLADATPGATIRYTLDSSAPTPASRAYSTPFTLTGNATVNAYAMKKGMSPSAGAVAAFTVTPSQPLTYMPIACGQTLPGNMTAGAPYSTFLGQGYHADGYTFQGTAGETVTLSMNSAAFDTYLVLKDPSGNVVAVNDDSNGTTNAQIVYTLLTSGAYTVEATSFVQGATGAYTLGLACSGNSTAVPHFTLTLGGANVPQGATPQSMPALDYGSTSVGAAINKTFTITNTGNADLTISQASIPGGFTLAQTMSSPIPAGKSSTFVLRFDATNPNGYPHPQTGTVSIVNGDPSQNPFTFTVTGTASSGSTSNNPKVPQGGCSTFPAYGSPYPNGAYWYVFNPAGTKIASDTAADGPGPGGWAVSYAANSLTVCAPGTAPVATGYQAQISISGQNPYTVQPTSFDVVPAPNGLASLGLAPDPVVGGTAAQGTVTLVSAAPAGGAVVTLSSANAALAAVPASVTVAAGATSATFPVTTTGVATATDVAISATLGGTATATLTVSPAPVAATPVITGTNAQGNVIPSGGRFNGALTVTIQSATPGAAIYYTLDGTAPTASSAVYTGPLSLTATTTVKAFAALTGYATSGVATATYTHNAPPTVSLTAPANGAAFHTGDNLTLSATASDSDGTVTQVQFLASSGGGSYLVGRSSSNPYTIVWAGVPAGAYTLTAVATDNDGGTATSAPVTVTVSNGLRTTPIACGQGFAGALTASSGASTLPGFAGHYADLYTFAGSPNLSVTLSLNSSAFEGYLTLRDPSGNAVAQNDAGSVGGTAQVTYTLPANAAGTYTVEVTTYAPGVTGAYTLRLDCSGAGSVPGIAVSVTSGGVTSAVANNGTVDFGPSPVGTPVTKTFTVTNTGGADLAITSFFGSSGLFAATTSPSSPIPAGQSTTFTVRFTPDSNGVKTGTVTLGSNVASANPFTINLTGTGGTGTALAVTGLALSPASVPGGASSTGTVTLSGAAPAGGQTVSLTSSAAAASVPASVVVAQGKTTATFTVATTAVAAQATATVTAALGTSGQPGFSSQSATLTITAAGTVPTVTLSANPTSAAAPANITLTATPTATTAGATVAKVEFFQGTTRIGQVSASPYTFVWQSVPGGSYSLSAKVTDSNGLSGTSSPAVAVTVTTAPAATAPVISPAAGAYTGLVRVTITDTQAGAAVFYTTDGSDPTPASPLYRQPLLLTSTTTVKAKAFATGDSASTTASSLYTITAGAATTPTAGITAPADGAEITGPTAVTAGLTSSVAISWEMDYQRQGDAAWTPFASGTQPGSGAISGPLDTTLLLNGQYQIRLLAVDANGQQAFDQIMVVVKGDQKVGYFTLSYTDMTVPLAGMPISVTRTYDSRNKSAGDFGVGWTLSTTQVSFQKREVSGFDWVQVGSSSYKLLAVRPHLLTFTLPNGDVYNFAETLEPNQRSYYPLDSTDVHYQQVSGRPASLVPLDQNPTGVYVASIRSNTDPNTSASAIELYEDADLNAIYDPQRFQLTLANGTKVVVDKLGGLISITDRSGNVVNFSPSDIQNIAGTQDIKISRLNGLISSITDLNGKPFSYAQDASGNLGSATDRNGNTTTYDYDALHNLTAIHTPDGNLPLANYYYPDGRLNYSLDANGNRVKYDYSSTLEPAATADRTAPTNTQITTDPLGNRVQMAYDSYGNVLSWTKYLSGRPITTSYTYNASSPTNPDKPTSMTDPLGRTTFFGYDGSGNLNGVSQDHTDANGATTTLRVTSTYNAFGEVLTTQNVNQQGTNTNEITNGYDAAGHLMTSTDALGNTTTCTYNPTGTLASLTDALHHTTQYTYDSQGNVTSTIGPTGSMTRYTYDGNGKVLSTSLLCTLQPTATQPQTTQTVTLQFQYDADGHQIRVIGPDSASASTHYNSLNQVDQTTDAAGRVTRFVYDGMGHQAQVNYPGGMFSKTTFDAAGNVLTSTNTSGRVAGYAYDSLYRLVQSGPVVAATPLIGGQPNWLLDASNRPFYMTTTYNDDNTVAARTDARGNTSKTVYDDLARPVSSTDALGFTSRTAYDGQGNVLSVTDANNHTTTFAYDADNRGTGSTYPDNTSNSITYDARGHKIAATDQDGRTTQYSYDPNGHLLTVTTPMGEVTRFGYDETGRKISQTDANGHTTFFAYDITGRLIQKTLPLGQYETMTYNPDSTLASMTDYNGNATLYGYDAAGRGNVVTHGDGTGVTTAYNLDGTVQQMTRTVAGGGTVVTNYGYDPNHGWLSSVQTAYGAISNTVSYGYDTNGRLAFVQSPSGKTQYTYDADSRLQTVVSPDLKTTTYSYDKVGNRYQLALPNGVTATYGYDSLNRLTTLTNSAGPSYGYRLDLNGQRLSMTDSSAGMTAYSYDKDGRLLQETFPNATSTVYAYDAVGNRKSLNGVAWTYDANDRLLNAGNITYAYDNNGNVLRTGGATCTYDAENHLLTTGASSYLYDAGGNRVQAVVSNAATNYVVDTVQSYASVIEERDGGNALVAHYDYGADRLRMDRGGAYYYVYDGLGSVRALTNAGGTVTDTYAYDAFGNTAHGLGASPNPYQFNGQSNDGTGLYFLRARYYNPGDGRFLSQDPLMGSEADPASLHRYLYASADPVNRMDPGGREDFSLSGVLAATGVASSLGGILDAAEFAIKDEFAAAAGVDISQEKVIAATITGNLGLGNDWVGPIQESVQRLEWALIIFQVGSHIRDLSKAVMKVHVDPPFSKFESALADSDNALDTLAGEDEEGGTSGEEDNEIFGSAGDDCDLCLVAGSGIEMADGTIKAIETLQPNDLVVSRDPETSKTEAERVTRTISRKTAVLVTLTFDDLKTGKVADIIRCTPEHPLFVLGKGWIPAGMLVSGDLIATGDDDALVVAMITWQRDEKHGFAVYNLTIEDDHTYFVGTAHGGIWVHNCQMANKLAANMKAKYGIEPPGGNRWRWRPHHIVPWGDKRAKQAQDVLIKFSIDFNDAENGIYLPQFLKDLQGPGLATRHPRTMTDVYFARLNADLGSVKNGTKNDVLNKLSEIQASLSNGTYVP